MQVLVVNFKLIFYNLTYLSLECFKRGYKKICRFTFPWQDCHFIKVKRAFYLLFNKYKICLSCKKTMLHGMGVYIRRCKFAALLLSIRARLSCRGVRCGPSKSRKTQGQVVWSHTRGGPYGPHIHFAHTSVIRAILILRVISYNFFSFWYPKKNDPQMIQRDLNNKWMNFANGCSLVLENYIMQRYNFFNFFARRE